jgi:hypothetical protein
VAFRALEGCKRLERFPQVKWNEGNMQIGFRKDFFAINVFFPRNKLTLFLFTTLCGEVVCE